MKNLVSMKMLNYREGRKVIITIILLGRENGTTERFHLRFCVTSIVMFIEGKPWLVIVRLPTVTSSLEGMYTIMPCKITCGWKG